MKISSLILSVLLLCAGATFSQAQVIEASKNVPMEKPEIKKVKTRVLLRGDFIPIVFQVIQPSEDFPAPVVAIVTRNVFNFYGSEVLIPVGSKLIGRYLGKTNDWNQISFDGLQMGGGTLGLNPPFIACSQLGVGGIEDKDYILSGVALAQVAADILIPN